MKKDNIVQISFFAFDYGEAIHSGEIFICPAVADENAKRHKETLMAELARYLIHGLLHMSGYDDKFLVARRKMKREENRLLRQLLNNG